MCKKTKREYQGGYVPVHEAVLLEVVAAAREHRAGYKCLVRVFAAICEEKALKEGSKVDLYRIVNCQTAKKGLRRLSTRHIEDAAVKVRELAEAAKERPERRKRPVSRKLLRAIAQGRLSACEAIVALFYASRRISQSRDLERLNPEERYARFKYSEIEEVTGIGKSRIGDAVAKLREKGILHVVEVHQSNVNAYGLCFVDGWLISLVRTMVECGKRVISAVKRAVRNRTATPLVEKSNAAGDKTATLTKKNIKTKKEEKKILSSNKNDSLQEVLARLKRHYEVFSEDSIPQTA